LKERERIRWRCRRGLLELDLILTRFLERHLQALDAAQIAALDTLLNMPDNDLLDLVMGRTHSVDPDVALLLRLLVEV
jgi:antitoxin CptB